jgi:hypothetical protein
MCPLMDKEMLYIYIMDFYSAVEKEIMLFSEKMD